MLDNSDCKYTLWICNTYCFSTPIVVRRTCLNFAFISTLPVLLIPNVLFPFLYVSLISCDFCFNVLILPFYYFYIQSSFVELAFVLEASVAAFLSTRGRIRWLWLLVWSFWFISLTCYVTRSRTPVLFVLVAAREWHGLAAETTDRKYCCTSWSPLAL